MQPNQIVTLTEDVKTKGRTVGKAGDKVTIIAVHNDVLIVEGKERYSVNVENVKE